LRAYELMFIIDPTLDSDAAEKIIQKVSQVIAAQGGEISNLDRWGKRRLAYEIDGHREGTYNVIQFRCSAAGSQEVNRVLRITDGVIRHLLVKQEDD